MSLVLYQDKLAKNIDEWHEELISESGDFAFVITSRDGDVAMTMIDKDKNIYVNEEARDQLSKLWAKNYVKNAKFLLPGIADHINEYGLAITGITVQKTSKRSKAIGMGKRFLY
ncbi:hypothetical protein APA_4545 [Pseudanabaena sp. lw0831]|nr:hypothetical protein APA_4545 [Pseudanabaena sp. lw0831]